MNTLNATGWLQKPAWFATSAATKTRVLCFDVFLINERDGKTEPAPWRCEIEELTMPIQRYETKLVAGAGVMVRGELCTRPFTKNGVHTGFSRFIQVDRLEFSRLPVAADQLAPETAEAEV